MLSGLIPLYQAAFCSLRAHSAFSGRIQAEQIEFIISMAFLNLVGTLPRTRNRSTMLEHNKAMEPFWHAAELG